MIAAYNMARWRRAMGMTQDELGAELGGWTKGTVSAAERAWDGKEGRGRKFDADLICDLAGIFAVPFAAFFLPPDDDGEDARYVIETGDGPAGMEWFFNYLWPEPDWAPGTPAAVAYQQAIITASARYGATNAEKALAAAAETVGTAETIADALDAARGNRAALAGLHALIDSLAEDNRLLQEALERALAAKQADQ